jgi:uncharacterized Zn finger protein (UPF0148 family)
MDNVKRMTEILASHGIRMSVGGCGCCGSPYVRFEADGEVIMPEADNVAFDMFHEDEDKE